MKPMRNRTKLSELSPNDFLGIADTIFDLLKSARSAAYWVLRKHHFSSRLASFGTTIPLTPAQISAVSFKRPEVQHDESVI